MSKPRRYLYLIPAAVIFIIDLATKQWAADALNGSPPVVLTPFLRFIYVENTGAAFGFLADSGDIARWGLLAVTVIFLCVLAYYFHIAGSRFEMLMCALMLGGGAGNLYDRVRWGYVIDFIDAHWQNYHWPAFNVADSAITCGALLLICALFVDKETSLRE